MGVEEGFRRFFAAGRWLGPLLLLTTIVAAAVTPSAAHATGAVRIASPRMDSLQTGAVNVVVRTQPGVGFRADLDGKDVSGVFARKSDRRWRARISRKTLRRGANHLSVRTDGGGFDSVRFISGKRSRGFLELSAPARSRAAVRTRFHLADDPDLKLAARLNGHRVEDAFRPEFGSTRTARLSASHGLHFGTNRLRVVAARADGTYDAETERIRVPRTAPLIGAGKDRLVRGRVATRLDGSRSKPAIRGARLRYSWKLVDAPPGSETKLKHKHVARPFFRPDAIGDYRLRLEVSEERGRAGAAAAGRNAVDSVTITNGLNAPPIGTPVDTLHVDEYGDVGIQIGSYFEPINTGLYSVQAVIVDRASGQVLYQQQFDALDPSAPTTLGDAISNLEAQKPLVFLTWLGDGQEALYSTFNDVISQIGGSPVSNLNTGTSLGLSVIGVAGSPGSAWVNPTWDHGPGPGGLDGYLQQDSQGYLAFVPGERTAFDSIASTASADSNEMRLGDQKLPSQPLAACGTGGFQVELVSAEFLAPASSQTYTTNGCGLNQDQQGQQDMAAFLQDPTGFYDPGAQLLLIQSIGQPRGDYDGNWETLADAIGRVGGNSYVFSGAEGSYALFTGLQGFTVQDKEPAGVLPDFPVVESSESETGAAAHITAIVERTEQGYFGPEEASPTNGAFTFDLSLLTYEPSSGPPFPNSTTPEQKKALAYIANYLDLNRATPGTSCYVPSQPDVRSEYCNSKYYTSWGHFADELEAAPYPTGKGFTEATWNTIKAQLAGPGYSEFEAVQTVWSEVSVLQGAYTSSGLSGAALVEEAAANVQDSLVSYGKETGPAVGTWEDIFANVLSAVTYIAGDSPEGAVIETSYGLLSSGLYLAEDFTKDPAGTPDLADFDVEAADLASSLQARFSNVVGQFGLVGDLIVTDADKLHAFYQDPQYGIDAEALGRIAPVLGLGSARFAYTSLLPSAYELVELTVSGINNGVTDADDITCFEDPLSPVTAYHPFAGTPDSAQWYVPATNKLYVLVERAAKLPGKGSYQFPPTPSAELMDLIFAPYATGANGEPTAFNFSKETLFPSLYDLGSLRVSDCSAG